MVKENKNIGSTQKVRSKPERGAPLSENLAPPEQPGAAQLMRKLQNRLRRKQTSRAEASKLSQRVMPLVNDFRSGQRLSEIATPEMNEILQDVQQDPTGEEDDPGVLSQTIGSLGKVAAEKSVYGAVKEGIKTGFRLRRNIEQHRSEVFLIALTLALLKDALDIGLLELASWIDWTVDLSILITLRIFLFRRGTWKVRIVLWIIGPLEMIPIFGILPSWTCCVFFAWYKSKKKADKSKEQLDKLNKKMGELTGTSSGRKGGGGSKKKRFERLEEQEALLDQAS